MAAEFPPIAISIESQCTEESPCRELYQVAGRMLDEPAVLTNSILLGFPYADVPEMGSAVIVVTEDDLPQARQYAQLTGRCPLGAARGICCLDAWC